jgi:hypothetical protein
LFKRVLGQRHKFAIILHDPDRDAYPPNLAWTNYSMNLIMGLTDFAFYHDSLPDKSYYKTGTSCVYLDLPHGIFRMPEPDTECLSAIQKMNPTFPGMTDKLFSSLDDHFEFEQSARQFYSNPATTVPNDQGAFAAFCYGEMISCKEGNQFACVRDAPRYNLY